MHPSQIPLREVQVRLARPDDVPRWNELMRCHDYLGFRKMCGRWLHHVVVWRGRWLALLGWHAAALHSTAATARAPAREPSIATQTPCRVAAWRMARANRPLKGR